MAARGERKGNGNGRVEMLDLDPVDQPVWAPVPRSTSPADTAAVTPAKGSRRHTHIALGAVGALVAIVVVANALGGPEDRPTTAATTTAISTTTAAPTTTRPPATTDTVATADEARAPVVLADPPPGYTLTDAERYESGVGPSIGQLWTSWATDPAAATWVSILAWPTDASWGASGTGRVWLRGGVGLTRQHADGTTSLEADVDGHHVVMTANRLPPVEMAAVMDGVHFVGDHLADPPALGELGLRRIADGEGDQIGPSDVEVSMLNFNGPNDQWIQVNVGQPLNSLDRAMRSFLLRDPRAIAVGGHLGTFGIDGRDPDGGRPIAIVDVDGTEVEMLGGASVDQLISMAQTLRTGTEDEWNDLSAAQPTDRSGILLHEAPIGNGRMRAGNGWTASLLVGAGDPMSLSVTMEAVSSTDNGFVTAFGAGGTLAGGDTGIQAMATELGVVLVARTGRDHPGAELRVTVADATYHGSAVDPDPTAPGLFAAVGFSELASYHAELIGADGTVLATLDGT